MHGTGLTGGTMSAVRAPTDTLKLRVTGCTGAIPSDTPVHAQKVGQRLKVASSTWRPIYMPSPDHLSWLEFKEVTNTPKNISKPSKSLALISLSLSTL